MHTQDPQTQLQRYLSFLNQDQDNLNLLIDISELYLEQGNLDLAQEYLDKASSVDRIACLGHQGLMNLNQGLISEAKVCFTEALTHTDTYALRYNLSFSHFISGEYDSAWDILFPLEQDEQPQTQLLMARILYHKGSLEEALHCVQKLTNQHPENEEALGFLALIHFDLNQEEAALKTSLQTLKLNPENYDALLVNLLMRLTTQETTIEEIETLLEINPQDPRLWFALGNTEMIQGHLDRAETNFQKAIDLYPEFYDCHIVLAWCQLLNDEILEALQTYHHAIKIDESIADAWAGLALIAVLTEELEQAEQFFKKVDSISSTCFLAEIAQAIYLSHKNPQKAQKKLQDTLKNTQLSLGQKLAFLVEDIQEGEQLH